MFLMHSWYSVLDYKEETIKQALTLETTLKVSFFLSDSMLSGICFNFCCLLRTSFPM